MNVTDNAWFLDLATGRQKGNVGLTIVIKAMQYRRLMPVETNFTRLTAVIKKKKQRGSSPSAVFIIIVAGPNQSD